MFENVSPSRPLAGTPLMDSSVPEELPNPEVEELIRKLQAIDEEIMRSNQELARISQMSAKDNQELARISQGMDRNNQRLDNLGKKLGQIEEGVQELQYYQQTALQMIFGVAVLGFQRIKEMGSSILRIAEYPKAPMLLEGASEPIEEPDRDADSALLPLPSAQPAGKKKSASGFSLE